MKKSVFVLIVLFYLCSFVFSDYDNKNHILLPDSDSLSALTKYVDSIAQLKDILSKDYKEPLIIILKSGVYNLEDTIFIKNKNNITIKGEKGTKLFGGKHLNFKKYSKNIYVADLFDINVPKFQNRGSGFETPENTLMFYDGETPLFMARYPKTGFYNIDKIISGGTLSGEPSVFEYDDSEFDKMAGEKNLFLYGFFHFLWADATVKAYVDKEKRQVVIDPPYFFANQEQYNLSSLQGPRCYALNTFSFLSQEGEYYLDYDNKKVYVYSNEIPDIEATSLTGEMFIFENSNNITIDGIAFDMGQGQCIKALNCNNLNITDCEIKRFGSNAMTLTGGQNCKITNNDIHHFGRCGLRIEAGDYETLKSCEFIIQNNKLHDMGIIDATYTPCISFSGVGLTVCENEFYNTPSSVFTFGGNDCIFEYNNIHNACILSDDQGCIDMFCNSSYRGNIFRYNYFHDNGVSEERIVMGTGAIRFDDIISGQKVYKNVFINSAKGKFGAIQINCGRDNIIKENLIMNQKYAFSGGFYYGSDAWSKEVDGAKLPYSDLYLKKYPELKNCYDENLQVKKEGYNIYGENVIVNCSLVLSDKCYSDCEKENSPNMHDDEIVINEEIPLKEALKKIDFPKKFINMYFKNL